MKTLHIAHKETAQLPDFYIGTSFAVHEVELAMRVLTAKVRALTTAHKSRHAVGVKLAAEDVMKIAHQIEMLSQTLTDVSLRHINRKPRA